MGSEDGEYHLVGGLEHDFFSHILGIIVPTDELIFFRGVGLNHQPVIYQQGFTPPKTNILWIQAIGKAQRFPRNIC